jgi:hypothetical protein
MADFLGVKDGNTFRDCKDSTARSDISNIQSVIPGGASGSNKLATASDISDINSKIPSNASSSNKLVTKSEVSSAYHHAGTKTCAELTSSLLVAANEGNVYNMTDSGTTTADFMEGAGKPIKIGDNVGVAKVGSAYKFDLLSGFVDTSGFQNKTLDTPVVVGGQSKTTVESALQALNLGFYIDGDGDLCQS